MKTEDAKALAESALETLAAQLDAGRSASLTTYLATLLDSIATAFYVILNIESRMSSRGLCEVDGKMKGGRAILRPGLNIIRAIPREQGPGSVGWDSMVVMDASRPFRPPRVGIVEHPAA